MPTGVYKRTEWHRERLLSRNFSGKGNPNWKEQNVGNEGLHRWVDRHKGRPKLCEECGKQVGVFHWANISGKYIRDLNDFKRLCPKCHKKFDWHLLARGERHGRSKLSTEDILEIRKLYKSEAWSYRKLANKFNVSHVQIANIVLNKHWLNLKER
jgi:hypothetical protein